MSHPSWIRGLKFPNKPSKYIENYVASFVDAWIEIHQALATDQSTNVASFMDAWFEINPGNN